MKRPDWPHKVKAFLIEVTSIILLILSASALIWEHLRNLFR
jgi:hypothetical protein